MVDDIKALVSAEVNEKGHVVITKKLIEDSIAFFCTNVILREIEDLEEDQLLE
jgi:hypothetical protein